MFLRVLLPLLFLAGCGSGETDTSSGNAALSAPAPAGDAAAPKPGAGQTIAQTLSQSPDHSRLLAAVRAAGLEKVLSGAGPYTVFAPTDAAFAALPSGAGDALMQPTSKGALTGVLTYHVVPGGVTGADLAASIARRGGKTELATVGGGKLTVTQDDGALVLTDVGGHSARVTGKDLIQSNGVIHAIDAVLMPR